MDMDAYVEDAPAVVSEAFVTATIDNQQKLVLRAVEVANLMLGKKAIDDEDDVRSVIWDSSGDGKIVFISFNGQYEEENLRFPREYLWYSNESVRATEDALKAAEAARKAAIVRQAEQDIAAKREAAERKLYAHLKAKFEPKDA